MVLPQKVLVETSQNIWTAKHNIKQISYNKTPILCWVPTNFIFEVKFKIFSIIIAFFFYKYSIFYK